jgi:hypothetical protein
VEYGRTLEELKELVDPTWWATEEGQAWLVRHGCREEWVSFLDRFGFDTWFTITVDAKKHSPWKSGVQAMGSVEAGLKAACAAMHIPLDAFIVAEVFDSGLYHCHGMMRVGALDEVYQRLALSALWRYCFDRFGRSRFEVVRSSQDVQGYVSKYLTKSGNEIEWRLLGLRSRVRSMRVRGSV